MSEQNEQELLKRCQNGDMEAFETLIEVYQKRMINYCYRMLGNRSDAEDAAQEVFVKVFRFIDKFSGDASFSTWLYKVASNVCLDFLRKHKKPEHQAVSLYQTNSDGEEFDLHIEDSTYSPYEQLKQTEAQRALALALDKLSAEHKNVIVLRDIHGLSYEEIGRIVGAAEGTVKSRINRARLQLQKLLEKDRELFVTD